MEIWGIFEALRGGSVWWCWCESVLSVKLSVFCVVEVCG